MKQAIFFDLDGTLWDALNPLVDSYNEAMKKNHLKYVFTKDIIKSFMGLTPRETADLIFNDVDSKTALSYFNLCLDNELKYLKLHPGVLYDDEIKVLSSLSKQYDLYILSNAGKGYIDLYLDGYNLRKYFKGYLCAGDTNLDKEENIKYLKNKENIDDVIYIGDTYKDMIHSLDAGVKFIYASYGFGDIKDYKYQINNLLELEGLVKELFNN